jgi:hypothetical protein
MPGTTGTRKLEPEPVAICITCIDPFRRMPNGVHGLTGGMHGIPKLLKLITTMLVGEKQSVC